MKVGLKLGYRFVVKRDNVVVVQDTTNNFFAYSIEDHTDRVVLVDRGIDHGLISMRSLNSRTARNR